MTGSSETVRLFGVGANDIGAGDEGASDGTSVGLDGGVAAGDTCACSRRVLVSSKSTMGEGNAGTASASRGADAISADGGASGAGGTAIECASAADASGAAET